MIINIRLVASCWFLSLHHSILNVTIKIVDNIVGTISKIVDASTARVISLVEFVKKI